MSIFFSPDEPKYIDSHTGRMTRFKSRSQTFSREKDNTILIKRKQYMRSTHVVHEISELKNLREAYESFIGMFTEFNKQNGPNIIGNYMSSNFLHFKAAFEPFLMHASHYFNSAEHCHAVRRYSPLLQFSAKLLREWAILVSTMNKIAQYEVLPHLHVLQRDFEMLNNDVSNICNNVVSRAYYRDTVYSASNFLKHQITTIYENIFNMFAHEADKGIHKSQLNSLKKQLVLLSRDINENFLGLLPSSATATPEMTRTKTHMKAACGDIVVLLEAGYFFRRRMDRIQSQMSIFHDSLCSMLNRVGIKYEIDVEPLGGRDTPAKPVYDEFHDPPEEEENHENDFQKKNETESVDEIVEDIGFLLNIDVQNENGTVEKLSTIKRSLKRNTASSFSKTSNLSRVGIPPPINHSRLSRTALSTPRRNKVGSILSNNKGHNNSPHSSSETPSTTNQMSKTLPKNNGNKSMNRPQTPQKPSFSQSSPIKIPSDNEIVDDLEVTDDVEKEVNVEETEKIETISNEPSAE
ncbi:hypothetical protein TRFO_19213 [Tritrichomonas foetus]|uniref:Uncharacterized protein n=1 Tax=Tritrichomonas foetus TaxID=1144522 RepID=A0A1J4KJ18_9EUKA|nr:hypothetical protein TRFO_19213 [Tritrichomonas foetus]|eukprot:OHT11337.1 hypothetical protein TRFO_19213 [Tritrichomonas foetus]